MRILLASLVVLAIACGGGSYVDRNKDLLNSLPMPIGAERFRVESAPYYQDGEAEPAGWVTTAEYGAPATVRPSGVSGFFLREMGDEWDATVREVPILDEESGEETGRFVEAVFTRGTAVVTLVTADIAQGGPHTFDISVDHNGPR
jgi:hypothetical protein